MNLKRRALLVGLVAVVLLPGCGGGGDGPEGATVRGLVVDGLPAENPALNPPPRAGAPGPGQFFDTAPEVARAVTDARGRFSLPLPPGRYLARADLPADRPLSFFRPTIAELTLSEGQTADIVLGYYELVP